MGLVNNQLEFLATVFVADFIQNEQKRLHNRDDDLLAESGTIRTCLLPTFIAPS